MEVFVPNRVRWPHEFLLAGQTKDRVSYNQLSPISGWLGFAGPYGSQIWQPGNIC